MGTGGKRGSGPSAIQKWARIAFQDRTTGAVDETQQRAFKVITSTFVSTFHDEAERNIPITSTPEPYSRSRYNKLRTQLKMLAGMRNKHQLIIMFLSGAGGSGKTEVINSVRAYAKGFYKEIEYVFDKRMIVVTAMSGVAATLINGEMVHSAGHLNCKKITMEHQKEWANARMIIVDEISFASSSDIFNLHDKLTQLRELAGQKYGGLHVIFTGTRSWNPIISRTQLRTVARLDKLLR
jgi:ATP:corrinoid adenosyltransferase